MTDKQRAGRGPGAPQYERASTRRLIATVILPGTWDVERGPAFGYDTLEPHDMRALVQTVALYRMGEPVTVTLAADGRWRSDDTRVAALLTEYFGPASGYHLRLSHTPIAPLGELAVEVAWYLGGSVQLHVSPEPTMPGVDY